MKQKFLFVLFVVIAGCCLAGLVAGAAAHAAPASNDAASQVDTSVGPDEPSSGSGKTGSLADNTLTDWLVLLLAIILGLVAGRISKTVLQWFGQKFAPGRWPVQNELVVSLIGPANLALLTLGLALGLMNLEKSDALGDFCLKTITLLVTIAVLWYVLNVIAIIEILLRRVTGRTDSVLDQHVGPLLRKTLRVIVVVVGVLFVVDSVFDQDIGALLAGLGIAGLAVSLAAQDSLKNLFGSITILVDQPFRVGERIICDGYDGMIEEIGFRSSKIRTFTGHVVTIPNSDIVSSPVENIGRRPYIRRILDLGIAYDTPRAKVEQAVEILRKLLEEEGIGERIHPTIDGNEYPPRVYFTDYNPDSLNIKMIYWFAPPAYWDYLEHAQKLNLRILAEFEEAGIEFAFPTQTLYLAGDPKRRLAVEMLERDLDRGE